MAPVLLSHLAKYRSLLPSLALLFHLIDAVDTGRRGPVSRAVAAQAAVSVLPPSPPSGTQGKSSSNRLIDRLASGLMNPTVP